MSRSMTTATTPASPRRMRPISLALAIHLAFGGTLLAMSAWQTDAYAQSSAAVRQYDIPAGPLGNTLTRFTSTTGILLAAPAELVQGKQSLGIKGNFSIDTALHALLVGTGLEAVQETQGQFRLQTMERTTTLAPVTVRASTETANSPTHGFVVKRSSIATKTDTPLSETPQSVSVVPREQIEAQAADSVDQALQYTAGVSMFEGGGTRSVGTRFVVRGFSTLGQSVLYLNGSKLPANSLSGSMEPYHFERIEILKGPASIMYGQTTPGGIINLANKRPTTEPTREVEVQIGSWNRKQLAVDLGGSATEDERVRYRVTALQRDSDSMIKEYRNDRTSLNGTLEWQLSNSTLLSLLGSYDNSKSAFDPGKPLDGTLLPNPAGKISRDLFVGEPGKDKFSGKGKTLGYMLEHRFNDAWKFRQNVLAFDRDIDWGYASIDSRVNASNPRLAGRTMVVRKDSDRGTSIDNQFHGKIQHGRIEHNLLFGLDFTKNTFKRSQSIEFMSPLDLFAPVYGSPTMYVGGGSGSERAKQLGVYVQDQIKFDQRWIALIGGRYDKTRTDGGAGTTAEKADAFTPRLGLMYLSDNGITPYYSYSKSFQPTSGMDFNLNRFKPSTGIQHEIGVKYEPQGSNASVTVAAYEIKQRNNLTSDPNHVGYLLQTGEVRSRGLEIEARAELSHQTSVIASLAVIDAEITKSNRGDEGTRPTAVPRHTASVWLDHKIDTVPGMSFGIGVRHVGEQEVSRMDVPAFTILDAALRYQMDKWQFAFNLKNLADKTYVASCPSVCYYGEERNAVLTARYRW